MLKAILLGGVATILAFAPAKASVWTASGTDADGALSAEATFTTSLGQLQITIVNLLNPATIISIGQSISDIDFSLSNTPGTDGTNTASGQLANVDGGAGGIATHVAGSPTRWIDSSIGGGVNMAADNIFLEAIGHGSPNELIFPFDDGGAYPLANASVSVHSPVVDGPATFTLALSGVTANTTVLGVGFLFGTGPDITLVASQQTPPPPVPEPTSLACSASR
jgi:hypothetical protein